MEKGFLGGSDCGSLMRWKKMVFLQGIPGPDSESPQVESAQKSTAEPYGRTWEVGGVWTKSGPPWVCCKGDCRFDWPGSDADIWCLLIGKLGHDYALLFQAPKNQVSFMMVINIPATWICEYMVLSWENILQRTFMLGHILADVLELSIKPRCSWLELWLVAFHKKMSHGVAGRRWQVGLFALSLLKWLVYLCPREQEFL